MEKEALEAKIIEIFNSGIENVRVFRKKVILILKKNRGEARAFKLWDLAWSDDSNVSKFLDKISDSELEALNKILN